MHFTTWGKLNGETPVALKAYMYALYKTLESKPSITFFLDLVTSTIITWSVPPEYISLPLTKLFDPSGAPFTKIKPDGADMSDNG